MKVQEATRLEYGPVFAPEEPTGEQVDETARTVSVMNEAFTWSVLIVCLTGWSVIGLFLWIPRLIRAVLLFSLALVQTTVTETGAEAAGRRLRSAANFYRRGFVGAVAAIRPGSQTESEPAEDAGIEAGLLLRETAWALVVWYLILWAVGFPAVTPIDLGEMFVNVPWGEVWSGVVDAMASIPLVRG